MLIDFTIIDWLIGICVLVVLLPFLWQRKHNPSYLLFFSIFWLYLLAAVSAVIFPFTINSYNGYLPFKPSLNLIPFYFGSCSIALKLCMQGGIENIILTVPFGFGINFLANLKPKNLLWLSLTIGLGCELSQLVISFAFNSGFRAVDINDAILNAFGVLLGYAFFRFFAWVYLKAVYRFMIKPKGLFAYILNIAAQPQGSENSKKT